MAFAHDRLIEGMIKYSIAFFHNHFSRSLEIPFIMVRKNNFIIINYIDSA